MKLRKEKQNELKNKKLEMKKIKINILVSFICLLFANSLFAQYPEDFEGVFPPTNWARFDNGVGTAQSWNVTSSTAQVYNGFQSAFVNREFVSIGVGNTSEDWLVTPLTLVPANGQLRFYSKQFFTGDGGTLYDIRVSTTSQTTPGTFTTVQTWTEAQLNSPFNVYNEKVVDLSVYAMQSVYIAFVRVHTQGGSGPREMVGLLIRLM